MATIRTGAVVAEIRGSVGGLVFARNRGGATVRNRTTPLFPNSPAQSDQNAVMTQLVARWRNTVTAVQRDQWAALASASPVPNRVGDQILLSGFNRYIGANQLLALTGQTLVDDPPLDATSPGLTATLAHVVATGIQISAIGDYDTTPTGAVLVSMSGAQRLTRNFFKGPYQTQSNFAIVDLDTLPVTVAASAILTINSRFFFRFVVVADDGSYSFGAVDQMDVGATV